MTTDEKKSIFAETQQRLLKLEEKTEKLENALCKITDIQSKEISDLEWELDKHIKETPGKEETIRTIEYFQQEIGHLERAHDSLDSHNRELRRIKDGE